MKISRERLIAGAERVNRQFTVHRTLWILRAVGILAAIMNFGALLLVVIAAVIAEETSVVLLTGLGVFLLLLAVQFLVLSGVLVLWWVNHLRDREVSAVQADLSAIRDEVDRVSVMTRSEQLRRISDELNSTGKA